jgi:hypothetical protein
MSILGFNWVRAARTRAPSATNYDVYASHRKILKSPGPKCNGAGSSRPSTFRIMDSPRPGKWVLHCSGGCCTSDLAVFSPTLWVSKVELRKVRNWIQILRFALLSPICTIYAPWTLPISTGKLLNYSCCSMYNFALYIPTMLWREMVALNMCNSSSKGSFQSCTWMNSWYVTVTRKSSLENSLRMTLDRHWTQWSATVLVQCTRISCQSGMRTKCHIPFKF